MTDRTYCPKCKLVMTVDRFENLENCPSCNYSFATLSYKFNFVMTALLIAGVWYLARQYPPSQWGLARGATVALIFFCLTEIVGDLLLKASGMPRGIRRRNLGCTAVIGATIVGTLFSK